MATEIDLANPQHLADLLEVALPSCSTDDARSCAALVEVLRQSSSPIFDGVGVGERVDPRPLVRDRALAGGDDEGLDANAGDDATGAGATAFAAPGKLAAPRWTNRDRRRVKTKYPIYKLAARHIRSEPITSEFTGRCQSVRVRLPRRKPGKASFIGTWVGTVEARDHLLFSIEEVEDRYAEAFGTRRELARVDLITGARFRKRRFSPVSIYLAYTSRLPGAKPAFYLLEGGSAAGNPEALYLAKDMDQVIHQQAGFTFTPLTCKRNWYEGGLEMSADGREPACVYLTSATDQAGKHAYLRLSLQYARERRPKQVVHPFELQIEAALRVLAIAEQAGCKLQRGQGKALEQTLGPMMRALIPWDRQPTGHPLPSERDRFCGCPKTGGQP